MENKTKGRSHFVAGDRVRVTREGEKFVTFSALIKFRRGNDKGTPITGTVSATNPNSQDEVIVFMDRGLHYGFYSEVYGYGYNSLKSGHLEHIE
jgi:hypothetical protein